MSSGDLAPHLPNCPVQLNTPGPCVCPRYETETKKPRTAERRAKQAKYERDRRWKVPRIAGAEFRYDSVDHLPPIEIDSNNIAKRPPLALPDPDVEMTIEERKVRFLLMWNYSGGNWTLACQNAGVPRALADEWMEADPRFPTLMRRAQVEIGDRLMLRMMQLVGLIPTMKGSPSIGSSSALFALAKRFKPEEFAEIPGGDDDGGKVRGDEEHEKPPQKTGINIPRPAGPGSGDITGL